MIAPPARTVRTAVVTAVLTCSIVLLAASWPGPRTATAAQAVATDIYEYAGECVIVRDQLSNRYVVRDPVGYGLQALASAATPFRMQATDLGSYLLYGPDGRMPAARNTGLVAPGATADPSTDWVITAGNAAWQLTSVSTGQHLSVGSLGRLIQSGGPSPRWRF